MQVGTVMKSVDHVEKGPDIGSASPIEMANEKIKRVILVFKDPVRGPCHLVEELVKLHVLRQSRTDGQDVHETADQVLQIGMIAVGDDRADTEIVLVAELEEE